MRSGLEQVVALQLKKAGISYGYETVVIPWEISETRRYTPDFLLPNGIIIETKGRWVTADRKKLRHIREQHPDIDLRIVFSAPRARISKQSKTMYYQMAERLGIPWAKGLIPVEWLNEPKNMKSIRAIQALTTKGAK